MRAPVQSKRPGEARPGRTVRVRSRLIVAVAVVTAAVAGAGTPAVLSASAQLADTQRLLELAELTRQTGMLSHALSDERDEVIAYIAAGRPEGERPQSTARVDRRLAEVRAEAPASLRGDLAVFADVRREALNGKGSALDAHTAYTEALTELHRLTENLADRLPPRAGEGRHALADLDRAVSQAGAVRGLLLAAYATPRTTPQTVIDPVTGLAVTGQSARTADDRRRDDLTAAAQQSQVAEKAALDAFAAGAPTDQRSMLRTTVTGPEVATAERYLARLTDRPTLSADELGYNSRKIATSLTARIDQLRSVENTLATERIERLEQMRDEDVTGLELRITLIGALALLALGVGIGVARTLTRPLAVLRLGSARLAGGPGSEEPVRFTGRNDEFAAVVRSVNALYEHTTKLHARVGVLEEDRRHLVGEREKLACERVGLRKELAAAREELQGFEDSVQHTFVNLALRTLGLVERQLAVIESLEEREEDPERLATLFKLDHFATVMRRHSENLLVLAGAEHKTAHPGPVPLVDVVRAAVSEIERYERVRIASLPPHAHIAGFAADDLSHLLAELLENATSFSPPDAAVEVSGWLLESGEVMLSVQDEGIGLPPERLQSVNSRLSTFDPSTPHTGDSDDGDESLGLGLYVVARLAARHSVRVQLREQTSGGVAAVTVLPKTLLAAAPAAAVTSGISLAGAPPELHLAGAEAEANSNDLGRRSRLGVTDGVLAGVRDGAADSVRDDGADFVRDDGADFVRDEGADLVRDEGADLVQEGADLVREEGPAAADPHSGADLDSDAEGSDTQRPAPGPDPGPETTLELALPAQESATPELLRPTRIEAVPDDHAHERTEDESPLTERPGPRAPKWERVTDKGLPKRTPNVTVPAPGTRAAAVRPKGVDADALRRRLAGFRQGAETGRRDVEAELADPARTDPQADPQADLQEDATQTTPGDSLKEARS